MERNPIGCGIFFPRGPTKTYLPLERVLVIVDIVDVSAVVNVTQEFWQYFDEPAASARYAFPVPAQAAVCGFEMRSQDGKVIKAIAKDRQQARKEHEAAVQQGQMTGLVEHVTDDVFLISLGALPAKQLCTTTLTYVIDLMDADISDQVRFQLPLAVGMRYGQPPTDEPGFFTADTGRVDISINIRMAGVIRHITSPSHSIVANTDDALSTVNSVSFSSKDFLQRDFVLAIKADGLDVPRCFAETDPTGTTALQLTMVPKFNFPPLPTQEYIFLVDRSGSMEGARINTAKATLTMLLRSLPTRGTTFNVFDFGSDCCRLWGESQSYSEESLAEATQYVDHIEVNGGTEIRRALKDVFAIRNKHIPTACFVLTDGEAYDIDRTLQTVSEAATSSSPEAPLRMFTLGIGNTTSTAMCEGIARAGGGICLMAVESESIVAKTSKLLRASRSYGLTNASIDWGTKVAASSDVTLQTNVFRQAPDPVDSIYPSSRFVVFALVKHGDYAVPDRVIIKAQQSGTGEVFTFEVSVEKLPAKDDTKRAHLIHTLAARRIIQELDDRSKLGGAVNSKQTIVHLGEQYQLATRHTSFVAVEKRKLDKGAASRSRSKEDATKDDGDRDEDFVLLQEQDWLQSIPPPEHFMSIKAGAASPAFVGGAVGVSSMAGKGGVSRPLSKRVGRKLASSAAVSGAAQRPPRCDELRPSQPAVPLMGASSSSTPISTVHGVDDEIVSFVRLQSFDGSFAVTPELQAILGREALAEGPRKGISMSIWATVLAVAYLQKHLAHQPELLEGLVEKAREFVIGTSATSGTTGSYEEVLEMAKPFVV